MQFILLPPTFVYKPALVHLHCLFELKPIAIKRKTEFKMTYKLAIFNCPTPRNLTVRAVSSSSHRPSTCSPTEQQPN